MNQKKYNKIMEFSHKGRIIDGTTIRLLCKIDRASLINNKSLYSLINSDFKQIVNHRVKGLLTNITYEILQRKELRKIIENHIIYILVKSTLTEFKELLLLDYYFDINECINNNFKILLKNCSIEKLLLLNEKYNINKENKNLLNEKLKDNEEDLVYFFFGNRISRCIESKNRKNLITIITMIINELCDYENVTLADIKSLKNGVYSNVILIGDKVFKMGYERGTYNIPNSKYILKPIIRKNLNEISDMKVTIEVSEKVDTNIDLSEEELYEFYKKLRKEGIVFSDIKSDNVGVLLKDNIVHYENVSLDDTQKGFDKNNTEVLKKGELVIIDTDFLYKDTESEFGMYNGELTVEFEERYKQELKNEKIMKYKI